MPSLKFLHETNSAVDRVLNERSAESQIDQDGPEVESLWIEDAINELQKEIDHKIGYMNSVKARVNGPYGRVYSSNYKKNMREDFARFKEQIKVWKAEIGELKKRKKALGKF